MALKQITPPKDIAFLKSGLSLVGEEHGKVGSASNLWFLYSLCKCEKIIKAVKFQKVGLSLLALNKCISYEFTFPQNQKKVNWSTEPELKPIMKISLKNAASSQHMYDNSFWRIGCIWWFVSPFCDPCCPGYTPNHLTMRRRKKKLWNWATTSPCWRLDPGGILL